MKLFLLFSLLFRVPDLFKLYYESKYDELLKAFYQDQKLEADPRYRALVASVYVKLGDIDSAERYYGSIPLERKDLRNFDGLSFKIGELYLSKGEEWKSARAFYESYISNYRRGESVGNIAKITGISTEMLTDSVLKGLFSRKRIFLIVPTTGDFAEAGEEFARGFRMGYSGSYEIIDEEKSGFPSLIPKEAIVVGPLKGSSSKFIDESYNLPWIWISPYSSYVPTRARFFFSPYKSLLDESRFIVSYIVDSLREQNIILVRDTSWLDGLFSEYLKISFAERGRRLKGELVLDNPLKVSIDTLPIDTERVKIVVISGLTDNSYLAYSQLKTRYPGLLFIGTSGWIVRILDLPGYMLSIIAVGAETGMPELIRFRDEYKNFDTEFTKKYGYTPSELARLAYEAGKILSLAEGETLGEVLVNLKKIRYLLSSAGILWNISGNLRVTRIKEGNIILEEGKYGEEESEKSREN
ncbi:MAG: hypothetical protein ABIM31_07545 [candidate division WOR-3 bacterium]